MQHKKPKISPKLVVEFFHWMSQQYETLIVQKEKSWIMKVCAWFLNFFKFIDRETFMTHFSTTLGHTIYLSFTPGDLYTTLTTQIAICVHEHKHTLQWNFLFPFLYLFSQKYRAQFEVEAYICNAEIYYWTTSQTFPVHTIVSTLYRNYKIKGKYLEWARTRLEGANVMLEQGIYINNISRDAIQWLEKHIS